MTIDRNTIYNISNSNTGGGAVFAVGINQTNGCNNNTIARNRIYNISNASTGLGVAGGVAAGILTSSNSASIRNNQIVLGDVGSTDTKFVGILTSSNATATNPIYNNSIFIHGYSDNAGGTNNSYGTLNLSSSSAHDVKNNIIYNKRMTAGAGAAVAAGTVNGFSPAVLSNNLMVVNDTAKLVDDNGVISGVTALGAGYSGQGSYNANWMEATANLLAENLFTDTALGNLGINTSNPACWYANGKGMPQAAYSGDFNSASGVRSTSVASGATDIGSVEFNTVTTPPDAVASASPATGTSTTYTFANRVISKVNWGVTGSVPSALSVKYYSGVDAPSLLSGKTHMNAYTVMTPTGGSGYTFGLTLIGDAANAGDVNMSNATIARYTSGWSLLAGTSNTVSGLLTSASSSLNQLGVFTGTDALSNPLPVKLLNLTAAWVAKDVLVSWATASETNAATFVVERSTDGKNFVDAGEVKANGKSNVISGYQWLDKNANGQVFYYRLRMVDVDGQFTHSAVVSVSKTNNELKALSLYPNPFNSSVSLSFVAEKAGSASIEVLDITGKAMIKLNHEVMEGNNTFGLGEFSALKAGIYFVNIELNGEQQILKLIRQ
jgi:hypothetical protein